MDARLPLISSPARQMPRLRVDPASLFIKYMGSKASILDWVVEGINEVYDGGGVCDLFAGSAILSGALGRQVPMYSNDIQHYSRPLAGVYLSAWRSDDDPSGTELLAEAQKIVRRNRKFVDDSLSYHGIKSLSEFRRVEHRNRSLINESYRHRWHYFLKVYSGTWWSAEQCLWIDAMRQVAERYRDKPIFDLIMACLMHAMAYSSQGTGHFAQYRDAKDDSSLRDIMIYRRRDPRIYFCRRYEAYIAQLPSKPPRLKHEITAVDYQERLQTLRPCTIYADPPYCFVHYSRFYHALETIYLYDNPPVQVKGGDIVKGRYREERHQSPFCIKTKVTEAFARLLIGVNESGSNLVLSYSNTGMITLDELNALATDILNGEYDLCALTSDHRHMTMGRRADRHRDVQECLVLARRR